MGKDKSNELKKLYNKDYVDKFQFQDPNRIKRLLNLIAFNAKDLVLDIGCGDGALSAYIHNEIKEYIGLDFSENFVERANDLRHFDNVRFVCSELSQFSKVSNEKFDKIFLLDISEHVFDDEFIDILRAAKSLLNQSGKIYIHTPNGDYLIEQLKDWGILKQFPEHVAVRNYKEYRHLLKKADIFNVEVKFLAHYDKLLKNFHFLSFIPFLGRFFKARIFLICG